MKEKKVFFRKAFIRINASEDDDVEEEDEAKERKSLIQILIFFYLILDLCSLNGSEK